VTNRLPSDPQLLVKKLEMWTSELARVDRERELLACSLADLGVLPRATPPIVGPRDSRSVTRVKEQLIALHRRLEALLANLDSLGASILDRETMEVILPGGPAPGSHLSWQPGEPRIAWWRAEPSSSSSRRPLPSDDGEIGPVVH
jgi:hypothetical protein